MGAIGPDEASSGAKARRRIHAVVTSLGVAIVPVAVLAGVVVAFRPFADPLALLSARVSKVEEVLVEADSAVVIRGERRTVRHLRLARERDDTVRLVLSLPAPLPDHPLPVLIILGGLEVGERTLEYIENPGPNAYVVYEYPYSPEHWYERTKATRVPVIREALLSVPAQVTSALGWLRTRPWADTERMSLLGYSFGALLLPATHRMASETAPPPLPAVLAYGGTDITMLLEVNLDIDPAWLRSGLAHLAQLAIRPVEPALHAPLMEGGPFLLISGRRDEQIPRASWEVLHTLVPEPKEVLVLDAGHMHPKRVELTKRLVDLTREWLDGEGLYEPADPTAASEEAGAAKVRRGGP